MTKQDQTMQAITLLPNPSAKVSFLASMYTLMYLQPWKIRNYLSELVMIILLCELDLLCVKLSYSWNLVMSVYKIYPELKQSTRALLFVQVYCIIFPKIITWKKLYELIGSAVAQNAKQSTVLAKQRFEFSVSLIANRFYPLIITFRTATHIFCGSSQHTESLNYSKIK